VTYTGPDQRALLAPADGIFAAQEIKLQARTLAEDRGIRCVTLDYDAMRGVVPENSDRGLAGGRRSASAPRSGKTSPAPRTTGRWPAFRR
jgi:hypothetical protein